jgi:hypothetical protein
MKFVSSVILFFTLLTAASAQSANPLDAVAAQAAADTNKELAKEEEQVTRPVPALPEAPAPQTTCTKSNGEACPEWLHKTIGQYPPAPLPALTGVRSTPAGFWTFRTWKEPDLRTTKQVFTSKTFIILHAAFAAAVFVDIAHTHGAREKFHSELPVIPAFIGWDFLMDKYVSRSYSVEAPIYGIFHYTRDALK